MRNWIAEGEWDGTNQIVQVAVPTPGGSMTGLPNVPSTSFAITAFDNGFSLINWTGDDGEAYQIYDSLDFKSVDVAPLYQTVIEEAGSPVLLLYLISNTYQLDGQELPGFDPSITLGSFTLAALPQEQQDHYAILSSAYPQIAAEIAANQQVGLQQDQLTGPALAGLRTFYRVTVGRNDSDDDGLFDDQETTPDSNPHSADTDGDGVIDPWDQANITHPIISEFMAINGDTLFDEDGNPSDWIEIYNPTPDPVNLSGWYLSDKHGELEQWQIPGVAGAGGTPATAVILEPGESKIFFASKKNRTSLTAPLHTNFRLEDQDESVILSNPSVVAVHQHPNYGQQRENASAGLGLDQELGAITGELRYFFDPTPGSENSSESCAGFSLLPLLTWQEVGNAANSGFGGGIFQNTSLQVTITAQENNAVIYYTLDGSNPGPGSPVFSQDPLNPTTLIIDKSTVVRTVAQRLPCVPSAIISRTFIFPEDVLGTAAPGVLPVDHQQRPSGYPTHTLKLSGSGLGPLLDYDFLPEVIRDHRSEMMTGIEAIPSVAISLPVEEFFGMEGIYAWSDTTTDDAKDPLRRSWDRVASIEYLDPDNPGNYRQENCLLAITGNSSRGEDVTGKHNLRLKFRSQLSLSGQSVWFTGSLFIFPNTNTVGFKELVLRNPTQDSWAFRRPKDLNHNVAEDGPPRDPSAEWAVYIREAWARESHRRMGIGGGGSGHLIAQRRWVHLYLNGLYWGVYDLGERINEQFLETYVDDEAKYDLLKAENNATVADEGDLDVWSDINQAALNLPWSEEDPTHPDWQTITDNLDLENYIDYLIVNMFMSNTDWQTSNWRAYRPRESGGKFRFLIWDCEATMRPDLDLDDYDLTNEVAGVLTPHGRLKGKKLYQAAFKARVQKHFYDPGGVFSIDGGSHAAVLSFQEAIDDFDELVHLESARWGDEAPLEAALLGVPLAVPYFDKSHWETKLNDYKTSYLINRRAEFLSKLQAKNLAD